MFHQGNFYILFYQEVEKFAFLILLERAAAFIFMLLNRIFLNVLNINILK